MLLYTGPICLCIAIGILWFWWKMRNRDSDEPLPDETPPRVWLIIGIVGLTVGAAHLLFVWWSVWNELSLQFDPGDVVEMEIQRFGYNDVGWQELDPLSPVISLTDPQQIQEGLQTLDSSKPFHSNHESPVDGYSLRLEFRPATQRSDVFLAVHQKTSRTRNAHLVIPMEGPTNGDGFVGGAYQCDAFLAWFESDIETMFDE
ncbi:MAG: hypothetical protein HUJ26_19825 [Planctomycetaceae bacterium]|nr:hypothetical protein [Planctomycetaceae bacterium]